MSQQTMQLMKECIPIFTVLSDENRHKILRLLLENSKMNVNDITDNLHLSRYKKILFALASMPLHCLAKKHKAKYEFLFMKPSGKQFTFISQLVNEGKLHAVIDKILPLQDINQALNYSESGRAKGKIVIKVGEY